MRLEDSFTSIDWTPVINALAFSRQQRRITLAIMSGKSDKQIALELGIRYSTVRTYFNRICQRLRVTDRTQLMLCVFSKMLELARFTRATHAGSINADITIDVIDNAGLKSVPQYRQSTGRARVSGNAGTVPHANAPCRTTSGNRKELLGSN
jgi:DNA-binding CsgD family transcriptional regulator